MKKAFTIIILVIMGLGVILVGSGLIITKGNLSEMFEDETRVNKRIDETVEVSSLTLDIPSDNVEFFTSEDANVHIDYWDSDKRPYTYTCESGTATLKQNLTIKNWFNWFGVWNVKTVKVYLPASVNKNLSIKLASGDIAIEECPITVDNLNINISSGNANVSDASVNSANIDMSSGKITLKNLIAANINADLTSGDFNLTDSTVTGTLDLDQTSGSDNINDCSINKIYVKISSGEMNADNLTVNDFNADISSGDIDLRIKGEPADYSIDIDLSSGSANIKGKGTDIRSDLDLKWGTGSKLITCETSSGDIVITFID